MNSMVFFFPEKFVYQTDIVAEVYSIEYLATINRWFPLESKRGNYYWFEDCTQDFLKVAKYWQYPSLHNLVLCRILHRISCLQKKQNLKITWVQKEAKGS